MVYIFLIVILIFSIIIHEVAHGSMANYLGDDTAKMMGRLTLNPIKHLDPLGSIIVPLFLIVIQSPFLIGWAKPVPVNPNNFRDRKYGDAKVALAGPASNLAIALIFGLIIRFFPGFVQASGVYSMFSYIVMINLLLAIFNLVPIPPLDGSHILFTFLPYSMNELKVFLTRYGFFILIFFIFFLLRWLFPVIAGAYKLITGVPLLF